MAYDIKKLLEDHKEEIKNHFDVVPERNRRPEKKEK